MNQAGVKKQIIPYLHKENKRQTGKNKQGTEDKGEETESAEAYYL